VSKSTDDRLFGNLVMQVSGNAFAVMYHISGQPAVLMTLLKCLYLNQ